MSATGREGSGMDLGSCPALLVVLLVIAFGPFAVDPSWIGRSPRTDDLPTRVATRSRRPLRASPLRAPRG